MSDLSPKPPQTSALLRTRRSFYFATAGILLMLRTQPNARVHLIVAAVACALAAWLRLAPTHWAILVLTIATVLAVEALNTAVEYIVDLVSPEYHQLARGAKDASAAAVLIAASLSVVVGACLFIPPLMQKFS